MIVVDMQNDFVTEGGWLHSIGVDVSGAAGAVDALNEELPITSRAEVPMIWSELGQPHRRGETFRPVYCMCTTPRAPEAGSATRPADQMPFSPAEVGVRQSLRR